jgi:hypothetical protein
MITADELRRKEHDKNALKKETYQQILDGFFKKIKRSAEAGNKIVKLQVPNFVIGCPIFDRNHATTFLERQLVLCGYRVFHMSDNCIGVTWTSKKKKKKKRKPPEHEELPSLMNLKKAANKYSR